MTDYVWPSTGPERAVLARIGAEVVEAPDSSEDTLTSLAEEADGIMTCFAQVTPRVVYAARKCVVISRYGVGVDNIAVHTATEERIIITYVPDYCVDEVSDHVMALLLAWNRQIEFYICPSNRYMNWRCAPPGPPRMCCKAGCRSFWSIPRFCPAHGSRFPEISSSPHLSLTGRLQLSVRPPT
ncbi:MAG TPA: hypothetical protein VFR55_06090 [Dehalococcoidia bacterium]|nr:hypothetical protein [Dehalococcoidia bacterium]